MREKILLVGEANTCKTRSLVSLAVLFPRSQVVILDPDDGTEKVIEEMGVDLPNLTVFRVKSDWKALLNFYNQIKPVLKPEDWLCFDMLNRFWDLSQQFFSIEVFGESPIEHLMALKKQAKNVNFQGFDGLEHWALIKRLHNELLVDDAVINSDFNVMATTAAGIYLPIEKIPQSGWASIWAKEFGVKPEGEKHNLYRFDTQAFLYRNNDNTYHFRLVRDRGRPVDIKQDFDITLKSFMEVYAQHRGMQ